MNPPAHRGIIAQGLTRRFGAMTAVDGLDLNVRPGQVVGLVGPNGAGKTTTMRMLATLLRPSEGAACVGGADIQTEAVSVRASLGYLTGDTGLYGRLSPREILTYFGRLHGMKRAHLRQRIALVTELAGLSDFIDTRTQTLSTGQTQRVSLARAVLHDPPVLILDEPTSGLDLLAARDILAFFRAEADRGKAVLLSTHIMAEIALIADAAVVLHRGRAIARGTLAEVQAQSGAESLADAFLALLDQADATVTPPDSAPAEGGPPSTLGDP